MDVQSISLDYDVVGVTELFADSMLMIGPVMNEVRLQFVNRNKVLCCAHLAPVGSCCSVFLHPNTKTLSMKSLG